MENLTDKEIDQLKTLILFHIGYLSEMVSDLETKIKNTQNQVEEEKSEYLNQLKEIKDKRLNDLNEFKNIYRKISNIVEES